MDIFKGIGDFFGGLFGQKKKREDEQQQPQQQQSAVSFNSTPKLGDNFANNASNPTQPQQPKEFAKSSVDLNPVKPVQPVQPQPQVNRDQERQQLANKYRQEETDRYNQGSDHAANFLNDVFSGGKTAQMRENTINQNIQNRVNAEMLRKYGPDDQQVKQNIAQTSQDINRNASAVNDFTKNYNNTVQQTVASPVSAVKGAANSVVETMPKVSGAVTELGANTIKLFDEDNQFANNLINRVRADREKNIVRKTLNSATGLTDQDNKMAYGLGSSGTRMAIDAAMTPVTGGLAPAVVHGVEAHSEMMDSLDNIEARKKAEAAAKGEAYTPSSFTSRYLAATANAGAQAAIEKLGIDNVTGKIGGKFAKNMVGRVVTGALGEAGEEAAQQYAENFTKKLFDNKQNIHEGVAESALMGGIMGGAGKMAFGGMDSVKNPYKSSDMADGEVSISKMHPDQMGYNKDAVLGNTNRNTYYDPKTLYEAERNATIPTREKITLADAERQNRGGDLQYNPRRATNIGRLDSDQLGFTKDELVGKFTGDTRKRMSERSFNMLQDLRANNPYVTGDGDSVNLSRIGNSKMTHSGATVPNDLFIAKMRTTPRIGEILANAQKTHSAPDVKNHGIAPDGFNYYDSPVRISGKNYIQSFDVGVDKPRNKNTVYNSTIKETPELLSYEAKRNDTESNSDVYNSNIAQNPQKVNDIADIKKEPRSEQYDDRSYMREVNSALDNQGSAYGPNIAQNDQKVNDSVKYKLSPEQEAFFKDSKIRDEDGNLRTVYHGTGANFDAFDKEKAGNGWLGKGFYFTPDKDVARSFGKNIKENYINVKNPFVVEGHNPTDVYSEITARYPEANEFNMSEVLANHGHDGIQFNHWDKGEMITAFEPNQVKYTSNLNPTDSADMRFKQKAEAENLARVAKENLQARHQELTGDQSIAFNEWANELERRAQGFFDEKTGKITINDGDLNTLNHELGHKLLTRADNRAELLADIRNTVGDEALNAKYGENYAQQVANMNPEERANLFAEEYLADGFSDYYNGILAGEDSQRLGAKLGIPPRVLATYDRIVEAIKGILGLQQDTLKQFYAQAETGKFAHNYKQNTSVYNESPVYKAAFPKVQKEDLVTPELEKYGIKPTKTEYNQALEYILMEERPELFERYEKARLGLEALEENIDFNQFTPTELERLYGKNYAEHLDHGMISQMVRKNSLNGLDQAAMGGDIGEIDMEDYIDRLNHYYETKREVKDLEQEIREAYADPELREEAKQALWFNKYEEIENAVANLRQNGVDIDFDGYVELKYGNKAKNEAVKTEEEPSSEDIIDENTKTDKNIVNETPLVKETGQKTRKFAETVLDTDTPPKDFVKLMHAGDESLKYTPKKNSEMWSRATKSVQESPERVFNELENTRVANDETMAKGIALAKHYQAMGDDLKASELYVELAKKATEAGRTVQALNLMRRTTPEGVLMSTVREVESYNDKMKNKPNKQINITPEQRAEFLGKLRKAYAMPEGN